MTWVQPHHAKGQSTSSNQFHITEDIETDMVFTEHMYRTPIHELNVVVLPTRDSLQQKAKGNALRVSIE